MINKKYYLETSKKLNNVILENDKEREMIIMLFRGIIYMYIYDNILLLIKILEIYT